LAGTLMVIGARWLPTQTTGSVEGTVTDSSGRQSRPRLILEA
jgi:hypothetical protein